jgi:RNA polymerase sigma-B factor
VTVARIETSTVGVWRVVTAAGDLDVDVEGLLHAAVAEGGAGVVVDLSGVTLLDAACVHVLIRAGRRARESGFPVRVIGARGAVHRMLQITGADRELRVDPATDSGRMPRGRDTLAEAVEATLAARAALPETDQRRDVLRERAVQACLPLAETLAARYRRAHEHGDELTQVAVVGVLKAVDRFDPARGTGFLGFALPTILGEIRRYFRDRTWAVHVPRHLQDLRLSMNRAAGAMAQTLHREPTTTELAGVLDETVADVREAMVAAQGYAPASLSQPVGDDGALELGDLIGGTDEDLDRVDYHESLARWLADLPERERHALAYRFYGNMTQAQIAKILGVSQMHVSRLLTRALAQLRAALLAAEAS